MTVFNLQKSRAARLIDNLVHDPDAVAVWALNEQSGTIIDRCTKNRLNSASVDGAPTYSQAIGDFWGLDFAGTNDWIEFGDVSALSFERTDAFSVLAIVNVDAINTGILTKYYTGGPPNGWMLYAGQLAGGGTRRWEVTLEYSNAARILVHTNSDFTFGTTYMVGFSYSGSGAASGVIIYQDGAAVADTDYADTLGANSLITVAHVNIAAFNNGGAFQMNGKIGPVAVFNAVKTPADFKRWSFLGGFL